MCQKNIQEGNGNPNFTLLPNLKLLNEIGIIKLPTNFKLKETTTPKATRKKETKKKTTQVPPKAKAQGALARVSGLSVVPPKRKIRTARPKAKAPIQPKKKMKTPLKSPKMPSQPTHNSARRAATAIKYTSPRRAETAIDMPRQEGTYFHSVHNNPFSKLTSQPAKMFPLTSSLLTAGGGNNVELATSKFPSPQTKITFNGIEQLTHSREIVNPHPSPDTVNRMESAHPNPSFPSPPMPAASPTLLDTKVSAEIYLAAVAATHIPFESIGLRTRQRTQVSSQITNEPRTAADIGNLASGLKRKILEPPRKAKKGATNRGEKM
jgi:hypothetical protein